MTITVQKVPNTGGVQQYYLISPGNIQHNYIAGTDIDMGKAETTSIESLNQQIVQYNAQMVTLQANIDGVNAKITAINSFNNA